MKSRSILVVDDDAVILDTISRLLEEEGHDVTTAGSVSEGLDCLQRDTFDVVLSDILLGDEKGLEIIAAAAKQNPRPRIIAMSGGGDGQRSSEWLQRALSLGAATSLMKPFGQRGLLNALRGGQARRGAK
jgi:DNA-binding NtrC family response regulator